jgi:hypothetical protein
MKRMVFGTLALIATGFAITASAGKKDGGSDLAIGFDAKTGRPNAFIAWRNSQRILEVEVEVRNLGEAQATGRVFLAVLDETGKELASNRQGPVQMVTLPARSKGGADGRVVQIKGTLELNLLIDKLDRASKPYLLKAWIANPNDENVVDNVMVKSFNVPSRAVAGGQYFREYGYKNTGAKPVTLDWTLESSAQPAGWQMSSSFAPHERTVVAPGEQVHGHLRVATPKTSVEGEHVDLRVIARDVESGKVAYNYEWFVVNDSTPPNIDNVTQAVSSAYEVELAATVNDATSMLKEASGIRAEYSTDNGVTFSSRVMAYSAGNFVGPTSFTAELGPFTPGTLVVGRIVAMDIAGNSDERAFGPLKVTPPPAAKAPANDKAKLSKHGE